MVVMKKRNRSSSRYRKKMGQHFLRDLEVVGTIIDSFTSSYLELIGKESLEEKKPVVWIEIGCGDFSLTDPLLSWIERASKDDRPSSFVVFEADEELARNCSQRFELFREESGIQATEIQLEVVTGDFIETFDTWISKHRDCEVHVISNLPYSSGTAIFLNLISKVSRLKNLVLMFQKEVAARILASPKDRKRGSLSVFAQNYLELQSLLEVKPQCFDPPPAVMSQVITARPLLSPSLFQESSEVDAEKVSQFLKIVFSAPRKKLRAVQGGLESFQGRIGISNHDFVGLQSEWGAMSDLRAHELNLDQWKSLYQLVFSKTGFKTDQGSESS